MKRSLYFLLIILYSTQKLCSQDLLIIDSLKVSIQYVESDTQKIRLLWDLSKEFLTSDYSESLTFLEEARELSESIEDEYRISKTLMQIGKVYALAGDYDDALANAMQGVDMFKREERWFELYECYILIGIIHDRIVKYEEALEYYFKAVNIANNIKREKLPSSRLKEHVLFNNIGNIYFAKKEYDKSIEYYTRGISSAESGKDMINLAVLNNNIGRVYDRMAEFEPALKYLQKGLDIRQDIKDKAGMAKSHYFLCAHYMKIDEYERALKHATESLRLGEEVGSVQTQYNAMFFLHQIHYHLGNYKNAADYHVVYKELSDSMYNSQAMNEITRLKMQADFDQQEAEQLLSAQRTRFRYIAALVFLVICILVLTFIFLLYQSKSKRIRLEKEGLEKDIELKNKELATNVMYMVRKNEMINGVAKKLLELKKTTQEQNHKAIQNIILELQSEVDKNVWKEFELRFQNVHNEFYEHLQIKHPDLSPNESRLVAFLRLNMTTKEIAAITHQSIKSVEVARARLRKKLNLTGTDTNLVSYLNSL